jgi:hypothetical protein
MKPLICLSIALAAICNTSFANTDLPASHLFPKAFAVSLKAYDSLFSAPKATAKICACQILRVESNNEEKNYIAVFAQGTNTGNLSSDFNIATNVLAKEKKHMGNLFYDKVKVAENLTAATDCKLLYRNIKVKYENVKMYDILDADALSKTFIIAK